MYLNKILRFSVGWRVSDTHLLLCFAFGEQIPAVHRNIINIHFCDNDLLTANRCRDTWRGLHIHKTLFIHFLYVSLIHQSRIHQALVSVPAIIG